MFVNNFISFTKKRLNVFIACSLKDLQNFFKQSLPLHTPCLLSMPLNDNFVESEELNRICLLNFVVDDFSGLFLHPSIFSIKDSRSA